MANDRIRTEYEQSEVQLVKQALREHYNETKTEREKFYSDLLDKIVDKRLARIGLWAVGVVVVGIGTVIIYVAHLITSK